jgi:hypothetical protein
MNAQVDNQIINQVSRVDADTRSLVLAGDSFDRMLRLADLMAGGRATVPKHFHNNPADCMAVVIQSMQWGMSPFAVAQKTHVVSGTLGYEAQLVNAVITAMAPTVDRLHYEWFGPWEKIIGKFREVESRTKKDEDTGEAKKFRFPDWKLPDEAGLGVRVWATMRGEDEPRVLELLLAQARTRNSTLWADDPKQQLAYLATKRWSRLYCPDVIMGVYSKDELEEADAGPRDVTPPKSADGEPKELPAYTDAQLAENMPKWQLGIDSNRTSPAHIIANIRSKYTISAEQVEKIEAMAPIEGEQA